MLIEFILNQKIFITGLDNGFVKKRQSAIIWTNDGLVYWRMIAALNVAEGTFMMQVISYFQPISHSWLLRELIYVIFYYKTLEWYLCIDIP